MCVSEECDSNDPERAVCFETCFVMFTRSHFILFPFSRKGAELSHIGTAGIVPCGFVK